jgi:hypothetical protein
MAVRATMASLIARVRVLTNDLLPPGAGQVFSDQTIQDVMDESRMDVVNGPLQARPVYSGSTISYLDYYADNGGWEDNTVLKQFLTVTVTPALSEPIAGHWQFATTTLPPVYITGSLYDVYRCAADLLERRALQWMLSYSMTVDGQNLQRSQVFTMMQTAAHSLRLKQRPLTIATLRSDIMGSSVDQGINLDPKEIDYMDSGG